MIKKFYFFLILLLFAGNVSNAQSGQDANLFSFIVHGKVYDIETGHPLIDHMVSISKDSTPAVNVYTDSDGNYGDTIQGLNDPNTVIHISTLDCHDQVQSQSVLAGNQLAIVNFAICSNSIPLKFFNLGGLVFAGNFPINNPASTGDTGVAYLYRIKDGGLLLWDTCRFTRYGYYTFLNILEGNYKVRINLTPQSVHADDYFPSYSGNDVRWKNESLVQLSDSNHFAEDIHLVPKPGSASGAGNISGYVAKGNQGLRDTLVPMAEVILFDQNSVPLDFTMTGPDGKFSFSSIKLGFYQLYVEVPGLYSRYMTISLTEENTSASDVRLELYDKDILAVPDHRQAGYRMGEIYPDPSEDMISIETNLLKPENISWSILSVNGKAVQHGKTTCPSGSSVISIPVKLLPAGIYMFLPLKEDGTIIRPLRFVRK